MSSDDQDFEAAVAEMRFDDADQLLPEGVSRDQLDEARASAFERALALQAEILELGSNYEHRRLLELDGDPVTSRLLALLPPASKERADLQFRLAHRWADDRRATNERRLAEARKALDGLDLELARGLLLKIDSNFLDPTREPERDQMFLELAARAMELEQLTSTADRLVADAEPPKRKRWFRRGG